MLVGYRHREDHPGVIGRRVRECALKASSSSAAASLVHGTKGRPRGLGRPARTCTLPRRCQPRHLAGIVGMEVAVASSRLLCGAQEDMGAGAPLDLLLLLLL